MADHPETTALRLAEAATPGPYGVHLHHVFVVGPDGKRARGIQVGMWPAIATACRAEDAEWIAHAHPGRVRAWLGAVARLRERAADGHTSECRAERRWDERRGLFGECTCGHEDDLAALAAVDAEG